MQLKDYLKKLTALQREAFATAAETSVGYLYLIAGAHRQPSPKLAKKLNIGSNGCVTLHELRPDIFDAPEKESLRA